MPEGLYDRAVVVDGLVEIDAAGGAHDDGLVHVEPGTPAR